MEELLETLQKAINEAIPIQTVYATCTAIDWDAKTMTAKGQTDDLEYYDVSLGRGSQFKKPKLNTRCLIGIIENNTASTFLIDAAEIEEFSITAASTNLTVKETGVIIKRDTDDLKTVFNDMIDELNKIVVIYGNSINVVAMNTIKQRLNNILISN